MFRLVAIFAVLGASSAIAQPRTVQQQMPFESCVENMRTTQTGTQAPVTVIDTTDTKQVQYPGNTGRIVVTCSRSSQQVTIEQQ